MVAREIDGVIWLDCDMCGKTIGVHDTKAAWTAYSVKVYMTKMINEKHEQHKHYCKNCLRKNGNL